MLVLEFSGRFIKRDDTIFLIYFNGGLQSGKEDTNMVEYETTVGPRLIGPIGTQDFSPLSQGNL